MKMTEQESLAVTSERALKVFRGVTLAPQQETSFGRLLDKAMARNNPNPVPEAELEGIKEILDNLWHPELTRQLNKSSPSTTTRSETSESNSAPSGDMTDLETAAKIQSKVGQSLDELRKQRGLDQ